MSPSYPLNQSPFYRLASRQKLAKALWTSLKVLEQIANSGAAEYKQFPKKVGAKTRHIECPKGQLYKIASSLNRLLGRICVSDYVHSGVKGKSYHSNAKAHQTDVRVAKIDVKQFFPSASYKFVYKCFLLTFQCSPDVASVLTKLSTINGHIPTGSPSSTIISYYAYKPMFDEIDELAKSNGLTMSLCVDDMTFSGAKSSDSFLFGVYQIVRKHGLEGHKRYLYGAGKTKVVTGVAITPKGFRPQINVEKSFMRLYRPFTKLLTVSHSKRLRV